MKTIFKAPPRSQTYRDTSYTLFCVVIIAIVLVAAWMQGAPS